MGVLSVARAHRRDARAAATRGVGTPVTVLEGVGLDPVDPLHGVPAGAHVALVPTMPRRLVAAGVDLSRFGILLVGGAGDRCRSRGAGGPPRRPRGVDLRAHRDVRRHRVRRAALRGTSARIDADRERRASRSHAHGWLPARSRRDGGRVHARRLAAHRRHGRAGRRTAGFGSTADRTRRSGRAPRPCGRRRSRTRSAAIRRCGRRRGRPAAPGVGTAGRGVRRAGVAGTIRRAWRSSGCTQRNGSRGSRLRGRSCW